MKKDLCTVKVSAEAYGCRWRPLSTGALVLGLLAGGSIGCAQEAEPKGSPPLTSTDRPLRPASPASSLASGAVSQAASGATTVDPAHEADNPAFEIQIEDFSDEVESTINASNYKRVLLELENALR